MKQASKGDGKNSQGRDIDLDLERINLKRQ